MTKPEVGHFRSQGVPMKRKLREFPVTEDALLPVGTSSASAISFLDNMWMLLELLKEKGFR